MTDHRPGDTSAEQGRVPPSHNSSDTGHKVAKAGDRWIVPLSGPLGLTLAPTGGI